MRQKTAAVRLARVLSILERVAYNLAVCVMLLGFLFPILWMILTAFKPGREAFRIPPSLIFRPSLSNFVELFGARFEGGRILPVFLPNSIIVSITATVAVMVLALFASYALARFDFKGKNVLGVFVVASRMLPPIGSIVPLFFMMRNLGILDTKLALVLVYTALNLPLAIWILWGFVQGIPKEIEECATIDGCSRIGALFRIILPLTAPGLVAASIFTFIFSWNDFQMALFLTRANSKTLPLLALSFQTIEEGVVWGPMSAGGTLIMIPMIVFVLIAQKYLVKGLVLGGVKG
ncbi:MAG: carbohydrate ABC transporter permease [Firmicutes bacterium]|nr:carbohydrate ABC transporter permease [Bacillota bacterium]